MQFLMKQHKFVIKLRLVIHHLIKLKLISNKPFVCFTSVGGNIVKVAPK